MESTSRLTWKSWTEQQEQLVIEMRLKGASLKEIAEATGHSVAGVKSKARQLEAPKVFVRMERYLELFRDHKLKHATIAAIMGVKTSSIGGIKRRYQKMGFELPVGRSPR